MREGAAVAAARDGVANRGREVGRSLLIEFLRDTTYDRSPFQRMRWSSSRYTKVSFPKPLFAETSTGERVCARRFRRMLSAFEFIIRKVCSCGA